MSIAEKLRSEADWLDQSGLPEPTELRIGTHPTYTWENLGPAEAHAIMAKLGYEWRSLTSTKLYGYEHSGIELARWAYLGLKTPEPVRPAVTAAEVVASFEPLAVTA